MEADLVESWLTYQRTKSEESYWAFEELDSLVIESPKQAWEKICQISRSTTDLEELASLAAGPLEDLLVQHGHQIIEQFEVYTRQHPEFVPVAKGVWLDPSEGEVAKRVHAVQEKYS